MGRSLIGIAALHAASHDLSFEMHQQHRPESAEDTFGCVPRSCASWRVQCEVLLLCRASLGPALGAAPPQFIFKGTCHAAIYKGFMCTWNSIADSEHRQPCTVHIHTASIVHSARWLPLRQLSFPPLTSDRSRTQLSSSMSTRHSHQHDGYVPMRNGRHAQPLRPQCRP